MPDFQVSYPEAGRPKVLKSFGPVGVRNSGRRAGRVGGGQRAAVEAYLNGGSWELAAYLIVERS